MEDRLTPDTGETLDTLFGGRLSVLQGKRGYRFSLDPILLSHFVELRGRERIVDLGAGNGVLALILARRNSLVQVVGLELQEQMVQRALRSVALNRLKGRVEIYREDIRSIERSFSPGSFDVAVSNPPYRRLKSGRVNPDPERHISRHEVEGSLADFLRCGSYLVRRRGKMALIYPAARAVDLLESMRQAGVEPKRLRFVHSHRHDPASLVLAEGIKGARSAIRILPPLVVYREAGRYTEEMEAILGS